MRNEESQVNGLPERDSEAAVKRPSRRGGLPDGWEASEARKCSLEVAPASIGLGSPEVVPGGLAAHN